MRTAILTVLLALVATTASSTRIGGHAAGHAAPASRLRSSPAGSAAHATVLSIVPRPTSIETTAQGCTLTDPLSIVVKNDERGELRETAALVSEFLGQKTGFSVSPTPRVGHPAIVFELVSSPDAEPRRPEGYALDVSPSGIHIAARDAAGAFWAVQTLRQLLPPQFEGGRRQAGGGRREAWQVSGVHIVDAPRFDWRGSMLDVGRHFFPAAFVKRYIDLLALHKMNVFHWHLTEDQGWRIEIARYPRLTSVGAWRTESDGSRYGGFYTKAEIRDVVEYARRRHVTVVPEIEMPGHATAAVVAYPDLGCTDDVRSVPTTWGVHESVYCAGKEETYRFIEAVLDEVMGLFPSKVIHIGGDEVPKTHWKACPICQQRMRAENLKDEQELQSYFVRRVEAYVRSKGRALTGWDEILDGGLAPGAAVQVWRDVAHTRTTVKLGNRVVASPADFTYLNRSPGDLTLSDVYSFDPIPEGLSAEEASRVAGGEAPIWTEGITEANFDQMVFPRLAAIAEVLWSGAARPGGADRQAGGVADFKQRLAGGYYARLDALGVKRGPEAQSLFAMRPTYDERSRAAGLRVEQHVEGVQFRYTTDGTTPTAHSRVYRPGTTFTAAGVVRVQAFLNGKPTLTTTTLALERHRAVGKAVTLAVPNSAKYPGTGAFTLTDGLRGSIDFHDGLWQGWEGDDLDAVLDLGKPTTLHEIEVAALQDTRSWILLPRRVSFWVSDDRTSWRAVADLGHDVPAERADPLIHRFRQALPAVTAARYVRVRAVNAGPLPAWHPGAGGKAWIFADEIVVR